MAAHRRPRVDGFKPASASLARKAATVSGSAGSASTPRLRQKAWKAAKSLRDALRVLGALSCIAKFMARAISAGGKVGNGASRTMTAGRLGVIAFIFLSRI